MRRCCTTALTAMSPATGPFATAIRSRPSPSAAHRISIDIRYPRNSCTPIETYGVVADYDAGEDAYRCARQFPGPVQHPCGAVAGPEGSGQSPAAADAAGFRRQLRRQAGRLSLHRSDRRGGARRRTPGQMDRGSARASRPPRFPPPTGPRRCAQPSPTTAASSRSTGTRSRTAARICARRSRRRSIACTAI